MGVHAQRRLSGPDFRLAGEVFPSECDFGSCLTLDAVPLSHITLRLGSQVQLYLYLAVEGDPTGPPCIAGTTDLVEAVGEDRVTGTDFYRADIAAGAEWPA